MALPRFDNLDDEKKEKIIDAAGEEFAEKGYEGASINQIIKQAGISKGSLYYYFEDKADLFSTAVNHASERILKASSGLNFERLDAHNFWSTLETMAEKGVDYAVQRPWYMRLTRMFFERYQAGDKDGPAGDVMDFSKKITRALLERGQALGVVRTDVPVDHLAAAMQGLGEGTSRWLLEHWDDLSDEDFVRYKKVQLDLMRRLLTP